MVTSPTQKGVVVIGGESKKLRKFGESYSDDSDYDESIRCDDFWPTFYDKDLRVGTTLIELSGNSVEDLKWTILPQKMQVGRMGTTLGDQGWNFHITIPMTYEVGWPKTIKRLPKYVRLSNFAHF